MARLYKSGKVVEGSKYFAPSQTKPRSSRQKGGTSAAKRDANGNQAIRRLARLLNCGFRAGDLLLTPKYDAEGMEQIGGDWENAENQLKLLKDRIGRVFKSMGLVFRWVIMTSAKDEVTGEPVRLHHHMVVSGGAFTLRDGVLYLGDRKLDEIWGLGTVDWQPLRHQDDFTPLAVYLVRQARCKPNEQKWRSSRNIPKTEWEDVELTAAGIREYNRHKKKGWPRLAVSTDGELMVPAGCTTMENGKYDPETGTHYIRYLLPEARGQKPASPPEERRGKRGERREL